MTADPYYPEFEASAMAGALGLLRAAARDDDAATTFISDTMKEPRAVAVVLAEIFRQLAEDPADILAIADAWEERSGL